MRASLAVTTILYAAGVTLWLVVRTYRPSSRPAAVVAALGVLECALILQAIMDLASLASGNRPGQMAVHLAYVGASVIVLPVVLAIAHSGRKEPAHIVAAVGSAAAAIIVIRLQMTGVRQ